MKWYDLPGKDIGEIMVRDVYGAANHQGDAKLDGDAMYVQIEETYEHQIDINDVFKLTQWKDLRKETRIWEGTVTRKHPGSNASDDYPYVSFKVVSKKAIGRQL